MKHQMKVCTCCDLEKKITAFPNKRAKVCAACYKNGLKSGD